MKLFLNRPSPGEKGRFISKQNTHANDTSVNIVGENSGVLESNDRVSSERVRNKMAQNIMDTAAEKEKDR